MTLNDLISVDRCRRIAADNMHAAVDELVQIAVTAQPDLDPAELRRLILEREEAAPTVLDTGVAAPHAIVENGMPSLVVVGVSHAGISWEGTTGTEPVHIVVLLVGSRGAHLAALSGIARRLRDPDIRAAVTQADTPAAIRAALLETGGEVSDRTRAYGEHDTLILRHALSLHVGIPSSLVVVRTTTPPGPGVWRDITPDHEVILVATAPVDDRELPDGVRTVVVQDHGPGADKDRRFVLLHLQSQGLLAADRTIVYVNRDRQRLHFASIMLLDLASAFGTDSAVRNLTLPVDLDRAVFARVLQLAEDLAAEGREGKPVGALFVVGDSNRVVDNTRQLIVNPFRGYPESQRNILDPTLEETVKEFAKIDGAFLIRGDGVIAAAGSYLAGTAPAVEHHAGLGARHAAGQGITSVTDAIAIVVSESTRSVSVFRSGARVLVV